MADMDEMTDRTRVGDLVGFARRALSALSAQTGKDEFGRSEIRNALAAEADRYTNGALREAIDAIDGGRASLGATFAAEADDPNALRDVEAFCHRVYARAFLAAAQDVPEVRDFVKAHISRDLIDEVRRQVNDDCISAGWRLDELHQHHDCDLVSYKKLVAAAVACDRLDNAGDDVMESAPALGRLVARKDHAVGDTGEPGWAFLTVGGGRSSWEEFDFGEALEARLFGATKDAAHRLDDALARAREVGVRIREATEPDGRAADAILSLCDAWAACGARTPDLSASEIALIGLPAWPPLDGTTACVPVDGAWELVAIDGGMTVTQAFRSRACARMAARCCSPRFDEDGVRAAHDLDETVFSPVEGMEKGVHTPRFDGMVHDMLDAWNPATGVAVSVGTADSDDADGPRWWASVRCGVTATDIAWSALGRRREGERFYFDELVRGDVTELSGPMLTIQGDDPDAQSLAAAVDGDSRWVVGETDEIVEAALGRAARELAG